MAQTSAMDSGTDVRPGDSRWDIRYKSLARVQNLAGADPENNPSINDSYWQLTQKLLKAFDKQLGE